ncbi:MAG TPA: hypothetical protein VNA19_15905 [Pyrinomonadaceae bacterium]|nr:hypothetical protein [Pyrinomonadaceae bacterium]
MVLKIALTLTACIALAAGPLRAQEKPRKRSPAATKTGGARATKRRAADTATRKRRELATGALTEAATAAQSLPDAGQRAHVLLLVADAIWTADETSARAIFRRAWESATSADRQEQERLEQRHGKSEAGHASDAREEVLLKAATRDAKLAEAFLRELLEEEKKLEGGRANETSGANTDRSCAGCSPWHAPGAGAARRLAFARELLTEGEHVRAAALAAPVVAEGVSDALIDFLIGLREQNAAAADTLYKSLLRHTQARMEATDANAILLLSSYVVSPQVLVVVGDTGAPMFRSLLRVTRDADATAPPLPPDVRAAFFNVAVPALARRADVASDGGSQREIAATYFAVVRLLPLVEREAPAGAGVLRAQRDALASRIETARRESLTNLRELSSLAQQNPTDPLRPLLDRLSKETDATERTRLRLALVRSAASRRNWERARTIAAEIEETDARRAAQTFLAVRQIEDLSNAYSDATGDDFESAANFVRNADVPPLARAWGFAQAALLAARLERRERAAELLNEAARFAASTDGGTQERVAALVVTTGTAARLDARRAWEMLPELVGAANAFEALHGDEDALDIVSFQTADDSGKVDFEIDASPFRLDELFATMARLDFPRALTEARALTGELPRAFALISAARAALETGAQKP